MGATHTPRLVTPLVALIFGRDELYAPTLAEIEKLFGPRELESPVYPFDKTAYYHTSPKWARASSAASSCLSASPTPRCSPDGSWPRTRWKNGWQRNGTRGERCGDASLHSSRSSLHEPSAFRPFSRCINIDPGYITGAKLALASTKDFAHRIYLHDGIFAEITLSFRGGAWLAHECTFPDFRAPTYHAFLRQARDAHLRKCGPFSE